MQISKSLNLIIPVELETGTIYVHSMPISTAAFEANWLVISRTFSAITGYGLGAVAGPRVSALLLKQIAESMGVWEDTPAEPGKPSKPGIANGLMKEIFRLTNVLMPGLDGWDTIPFEDAVRRGMIDSEDASEVENALVFFTVSWSMQRRNIRVEYVTGAAQLWGGLTSSLNVTEYGNSLLTSTATGNSGEKSPETPSPVIRAASLPPH